MRCPFCNVKEIEKRVVFENKYVRVFPTNIPIVPGHVLICTKRHLKSFDELTNREHMALFDALVRIKRALKTGLGARGFNCAWNEGKVAGQTIPHFHMHVVPRKRGDTGITRYDSREFLYRPGGRAKSPDDELAVVANTLKKQLKNMVT